MSAVTLVCESAFSDARCIVHAWYICKCIIGQPANFLQCLHYLPALLAYSFIHSSTANAGLHSFSSLLPFHLQLAGIMGMGWVSFELCRSQIKHSSRRLSLSLNMSSTLRHAVSPLVLFDGAIVVIFGLSLPRSTGKNLLEEQIETPKMGS